MRFFAEIGPGNVVLQVIVADSLEWCIENLSGWWVETYQGHPTEHYAGIGKVYDAGSAEKFVPASE